MPLSYYLGKDTCLIFTIWNLISVVDPHHLDADPDSTYHPYADPDSTYYLDAVPDSDFLFDADPDPDSSFKVKAETLEKVLK
jgi:hypothetical protein